MITKVSTIIDDTGEVLSDKTYYSDNSSIGYNMDSGFRKLYAPLPEFEQSSHLSYWVKLLPYTEYLTNRIIIGKGKVAKNSDLVNIIKISRTRTYHFINASEKVYAMKKYKGAYYINPRFAMNGKKIHIELIEIFQDDTEFNNRIPKYERSIAYKLLGALNERSQVPC